MSYDSLNASKSDSSTLFKWMNVKIFWFALCVHAYLYCSISVWYMYVIVENVCVWVHAYMLIHNVHHNFVFIHISLFKEYIHILLYISCTYNLRICEMFYWSETVSVKLLCAEDSHGGNKTSVVWLFSVLSAHAARGAAAAAGAGLIRGRSGQTHGQEESPGQGTDHLAQYRQPGTILVVGFCRAVATMMIERSASG